MTDQSKATPKPFDFKMLKFQFTVNILSLPLDPEGLKRVRAIVEVFSTSECIESRTYLQSIEQIIEMDRSQVGRSLVGPFGP